jgi:hypothetical protein
MYERLVSLTTADEKSTHETKWGGYNDPLPNMKELSEHDFARSCFFTYCHVGLETRQPVWDRKPNQEFSTKNLFSLIGFYTNSPYVSGYVMSADYTSGKVRYFSFTRCNHSYTELSYDECKERGIYHAGRCYHVSACSKCGFVNAVDSSD